MEAHARDTVILCAYTSREPCMRYSSSYHTARAFVCGWLHAWNVPQQPGVKEIANGIFLYTTRVDSSTTQDGYDSIGRPTFVYEVCLCI